MKTNFILGVGCQKGGTSWLYEYLAAHPQVRMSPIKEMHIFDSLFLPKLFGANYVQSLSRTHRRISDILENKRFAPAANNELRVELERLQIHHDLSQYTPYFKRLTASRDGVHSDIRLVGEISPTYSALKADHFRQIKDLLKEDFNVKVVFLMRDPVDRIWSQQRMIEARPPRKGLLGMVGQGQLMAEFFKDKKIIARTAYDKAIQNLEQVFDQDQIFYGFYETLFTDSEIKRLCEFLGIFYESADFGRKVNESPGAEKRPDQAAVAECRKFYDETYRYCAEKFSESFIKRIWQNY